ncbi:MAG: polyribonucleotide nucleotidyltransferase [Candidatus Omnitrophica bacterium]|nr:polyribonucleotide nucleotidyltransferase [Candidatus Omnitrophota bacterium]MBU1133835.1 polyribonucleotide nucleotidyltransferase [Candidatus Omnitrophota bacterium]MBU1367070.1 polyribonucleotide nucleotidyltransferase [Candidatus Omnitrophota bacterium]MBU1524370.1 polyribonucleotide nucleotidyltransferase [Candidatus Omnitrophota bacterium]MBU1810526.1 polyribonucleotide nucleotidyltransferase [Candidatus Omnitrophota bacterium]
MGISLSLSSLGRNLTFSTGDWAKQAGGSVCVSYADTVVFASACMSKEPRSNGDFLPLFVEYQEKTYAMGKIPGGFFKKEGRPKDKEILSARLIDRSIRPLFPKGMFNEIQIIAMVLSSDGENDPDVLAINAASCALTISNIPFSGPIGAVRVSKIGDKFIINPTYQERNDSFMDLIVVGRDEGIVMLEGGLEEASQEDCLEAIKFAHPFIKEIISLQRSLREKAGSPKKELLLSQMNEDLFNLVKDRARFCLEEAYGLAKKEEKEEDMEKALSSLCQELAESNPQVSSGEIKEIFFSEQAKIVRKKILEEEKRPDDRALADIRHIECKIGVLPCTHGSSVFSRGQTQALAIITLGTSSDEQRVEALDGEKYKHFMLHYSFPPFSVGEIKPLRGPSRRDIGHGALAEKAFLNVIPSKEEFPYTIRVVSEILESNGSSSMATICATSLSLMDAGVPIRESVAGIAMGLVKEGQNYKILTDIAGVEDHYGDMDFKIAGTKKGITAIQLDIKIESLNYEIIEEAFERGRQARMIILEKMDEVLSLPREIISQYAPKIKSFKIDPEKIGSVIGPGGKIIRRLSRENNVTIDIEDDGGVVSVGARTQADLDKVVNQIINLTKDIEVGEIYEVKVVRLANFGAFCEILPGKQGLIHVSEVSDTFIKDVGEFLKEGDLVRAKVVNIDNQGKIALSIKRAQNAPPAG